MSNERQFKWERRFLELGTLIGRWSKDPSGTVCGAVIHDKKHRIISLGYNGLARGVEDSPDRLNNRETKLMCTIHAEENAILSAGRSLEGAKMVVTAHPCAKCAAMIIQSGINEVAFGRQESFELRWAPQISLAREQFREAGVWCHPVGRNSTAGELEAEL
jgi:dCMP deaminase